jgi:hypothetical protein
MIDKLQFKWFKSIETVEFEPGSVNVLIGANGSGKKSSYGQGAFSKYLRVKFELALLPPDFPDDSKSIVFGWPSASK